MNKTWKFEDIVDLDYFCRLDRLEEQSSERDLHQRDRQIFCDARQQGELHTSSHHRCLRFWLQQRRHSAGAGGQPPTPGIYFGNLLRTGTLLCALLGGVLGISAGLAYFAYTGRTPLNVFMFFAIFILPQFFLLLLLLLRPILLKITNRHFSPLLHALAAFLRKSAESRLRAENRAMEGSGRRALAPFFPGDTVNLLKWPLFKATQVFAAAFNIGLAAATLFKVATSDLAFGWQTTLDIGAQSLYALVRSLAWPWSRFFPESLSHPTLEQIEGSRIILKEGIYHLATTDLTSWWPFLLFCLLFYGLLPRLLLLLAGFFMHTRGMERHLRQRKFYTISRHMLTPVVSTRAAPEKHRHPDHPPAAQAISPAEDKAPQSVRKALVLIPVDLFETLALETLRKYLLPHYLIAETNVIFKSYEEDRSLLENMTDGEEAVVVVYEAWMAPIREQLRFLEDLGRRLRQDVPLGVCLLGRPRPNRPLVAPQVQDYLLWQRKINDCCAGISILPPAETATEEMT